MKKENSIKEGTIKGNMKMYNGNTKIQTVLPNSSLQKFNTFKLKDDYYELSELEAGDYHTISNVSFYSLLLRYKYKLILVNDDNLNDNFCDIDISYINSPTPGKNPDKNKIISVELKEKSIDINTLCKLLEANFSDYIILYMQEHKIINDKINIRFGVLTLEERKLKLLDNDYYFIIYTVDGNKINTLINQHPFNFIKNYKKKFIKNNIILNTYNKITKEEYLLGI